MSILRSIELSPKLSAKRFTKFGLILGWFVEKEEGYSDKNLEWDLGYLKALFNVPFFITNDGSLLPELIKNYDMCFPDKETAIEFLRQSFIENYVKPAKFEEQILPHFYMDRRARI